jgi:hypothetical protein
MEPLLIVLPWLLFSSSMFFHLWLDYRNFPIMPAFTKEAKVKKFRKKAEYYRKCAELSRARAWLEDGCERLYLDRAKGLENAGVLDA